MKSRTQMWMTAVCLFVTLTATLQLRAQDNDLHKLNHHKYKLVDLGTFGGANSQVNGGPPAMINNEGAVAGEADTSSQCTYFVFPISPAFKWENGVLTNLGLLPGGCFNLPNSINSKSMMVGSGDIGVIDPLTGLPEIRADFLYKGQIVNLGTFGGTNSLAGFINNKGQATGAAENTDPDPWNFGGLFGLPSPTAWHAFVWNAKKKVLRDLGTLGGPDSAATLINEHGQMTGGSFTNDIANPVTGIPTLDPFLREDDVMTDVGTLGGTFGVGNAINNHGQIVGFSDVAGDLTNHAFSWKHGVLTDIGTLGGDNSSANWINDAGQVVGTADLADGTHHAFIWRKGKMKDLGAVGSDGCSNGSYINASGQVVGTSTDCHGTILHAFLWDNGSMIALPTSGFTFVEPVVINDRGEIVGNGGLSNGDTHAVVLQLKGNGDEPDEMTVPATANSSTATLSPRQNSATSLREAPVLSPLDRFRNQMRQRYYLPGVRGAACE